MSDIVSVNLKKYYKNTIALNNASFTVSQGELFGFIGPDGAGKTTLFRILTTLLLPDAGSVYLAGCDVIKDFKKVRTLIGYMPQHFSLYRDLSVEENLSFFASIFNTTINENYELVKDIYSKIEPFKNRLAGQLSGGMKQKLALSCALIHKPQILILDEPTTGVDAVSRIEFWEMLQNLKRQGMTIVVSTPYLEEAELCDRVALIQNGNILLTDKPANIPAKFTKTLFIIKGLDKYGMMTALRRYDEMLSVSAFGENLHYTDKRDDVKYDTISGYLTGCGFEDNIVEETEPDIEDVFIELMSDENEY